MCDFGISEILASILAGTTAGAAGAGTTAGAAAGSALSSAIAAETLGTTAGALSGATNTIAATAADAIAAGAGTAASNGAGVLGGVTVGEVMKDLGIGAATTGLTAGMSALANRNTKQTMKTETVNSGNPNVADQKTATGVKPNKKSNKRTLSSLRVPMNKQQATGLNTPNTGVGLNIPT